MRAMNPATILVVDDDPDLLRAYACVLQDEGYRVLTAQSGTDALILARKERIDLLITDVVMPVMDGFELIQRLKLQLDDAAPPTIVCSGFDITEREALRRGARIFLPKPTDAPTLMRAIRSLELQTPVAPDQVSEMRRRAREERDKVRVAADSQVRTLDPERTAKEIRPWLDWLRVYLHCGGAAVLLLQEDGLRPLVSTGLFDGNGAAEAFLQTNVTCVVETRTSLVIGDARRHPSFRGNLTAESQIAFFAGVPLLTPAEIAVGALCVSDPGPRRFDAESLLLLEHLGRRSVANLMSPRGSDDPAPAAGQAPLLAQVTFQALLGSELRLAARNRRIVELAIVRLPAGVSTFGCALQLWRVGAAEHTAIGDFGPEQLTLLKTGSEREVPRALSVCLESIRAQGMLHSAGVVSLAGTVGMGDEPLIDLARTALQSAGNSAANGRVRRIVVRPDG
jgi:CheY-like chemotaxis protein